MQRAPTYTSVFPSFDPSDAAEAIPCYRVLGPDGRSTAEPGVSQSDGLAMYRTMVRVRAIDERMIGLQRQGRIGFYGPASGQEAAVVGTAHALEGRDWVMPALRESGIALHRGWPLAAYLAQCFGNRRDTLKGRQMPCHYGAREVNFVTLSSVIATQLPQAIGAAYAMALLEGPGPARPICLGAMGDGATSEGDFHVAMNFAGVMRPRGSGLPLVLLCQNNQWAISVPAERQTAAPSFASKAAGYGVSGVRVDGNDALAVFRVMREAAHRARQGDGPALVEALTYRVGAHTTSDDPSRYRDESVTSEWARQDPIARLRAWLLAVEAMTDAEDASLRSDADAEVRAALAEIEPIPPPDDATLFDDVYAVPTPRLKAQGATR